VGNSWQLAQPCSLVPLPCPPWCRLLENLAQRRDLLIRSAFVLSQVASWVCAPGAQVLRWTRRASARNTAPPSSISTVSPPSNRTTSGPFCPAWKPLAGARQPHASMPEQRALAVSHTREVITDAGAGDRTTVLRFFQLEPTPQTYHSLVHLPDR